jgi:hypothetical protein
MAHARPRHARLRPALARAALLLAPTVALALAPLALAQQTVALRAGIAPDRPHARVTIEFQLVLHSAAPGAAPAPMTSFALHLPAGLGVLSSALGLANCSPAALLEGGPEGCPANARVGFGSASELAVVEGQRVEERTSLNVYVGPANREHLEVLFFAEGYSPVVAELLFRGQLLEDGAPRRERLQTTIPVMPVWPEGPDIALTRMTATIGPRGLTYYRRVRGRFVPFRPRGIALPGRCPHGGFRFRADVTFLTGARASAASTVPCPR